MKILNEVILPLAQRQTLRAKDSIPVHLKIQYNSRDTYEQLPICTTTVELYIYSG